MLRIALFALFLIPTLCVVNPTQATLDENDNNVLRLALTLKLLSTTYFDHFQELYTRQAFIDAGLPGSVWDNLDLLRQQEEYHANLLQSSLVARTGQKLDVCQYNFSTVNSVYDYVGGGRLLANVGTSAYIGLFASIYNRTLQQVAATVATVEARHASYLNQVPGNITLPSPVPNAGSPFPNATDPAYSPQTVTDYVTPFIISCPFNVSANYPVVYTVIPVADPNTTVASNPTQDQVNANDITALNYLLSLEYIQVALFTYLGTPNYTQANFTTANYSVSDYQLLQTIRSHTNNHVEFLRGHVNQRGGTPSANCTYSLMKFVNSTTTFVGLAQQISNTLVTAYDGAMNTITEPGLRQSVASVATVEARQAAFLNVLTGAPPFVSPLDTAALPSDVITLVNTSYINSCATPIQAPQTIVVVPYSNETSTTTTSGNATSAPTASPTTQAGPTNPPVATTSIGVTTGGTSNGAPTQAPPLSTGGTTEGQATSAANVLVRSVLALVPPLFAVVIPLF